MYSLDVSDCTELDQQYVKANKHIHSAAQGCEVPEGECIHIRQSTRASVILICYTFGTIKICPKLSTVGTEGDWNQWNFIQNSSM